MSSPSLTPEELAGLRRVADAIQADPASYGLGGLLLKPADAATLRKLPTLISMAERCASMTEDRDRMIVEAEYHSADAAKLAAERDALRAKVGRLEEDLEGVMTHEDENKALRARVGELEHRLASLGQTAAKLAGRKDLSDEEAVAKLLTVESNCLTWMTSCVACAETIDREHARWEEQQRRIAELEQKLNDTLNKWSIRDQAAGYNKEIYVLQERLAAVEAEWDKEHDDAVTIALEHATTLERLSRAAAALEGLLVDAPSLEAIDAITPTDVLDVRHYPLRVTMGSIKRARDALKAMREGK